jgi:hypothetical protein
MSAHAGTSERRPAATLGLRCRPVAAFAALGMYERADLQRLLRDDISELDEDLLVVAKEYFARRRAWYSAAPIRYQPFLWAEEGQIPVPCRRRTPARAVRGHEKVPAGGQMRSPLVATKSPHWWPAEVPTPR